MSRNTELLIVDEQDRERSRFRLPYGGRMLVKDGQEVAAGAVLIEWDPYTMPIISELNGVANFVDLTDGVSVREVTDDATGISSREVVDWKQAAGGSNLRPRITLRDDNGEVLTLANGLEARYFLSAGSILSIDHGTEVQAGDVLARIPRESSKTRDITGGLPRVAELFEARRPKDFAVIAESDGRVEFGNDYKAKRRIRITPVDGDMEPVEYLLPKGRPLAVNEGDVVRKGDLLLDGSPVPHDILSILGVEALAEYLVKEIQDVYRLQGVKINDKHIEVIVRQMLQKVEVDDPADSTFLAGEQVDREEFAAANAGLVAEGLRPAVAHPVLLGITKASLQTNSFISAASFQEPRVS
jgi:DNA-directed RNA polymerase subunit beta'